MKRLRALWASAWGDSDRRVRLGRLLGLTFITSGFVLIGLAWNGAASKNFEPAQFPYLLSGGLGGLGLIVAGATFLLLATLRAERQVLSETFDRVAQLLGRNLSSLQFSSNGSGPAEQVVAGATAYHLPGCKILQGKEGLARIPVQQAEAEGLVACRVCDPPRPLETPTAPVSASAGTPAR
ncbi:MAG: hypothetical protein ABR575_11830 [Actinomycetota bacterium]